MKSKNVSLSRAGPDSDEIAFERDCCHFIGKILGLEKAPRRR